MTLLYSTQGDVNWTGSWKCYLRKWSQSLFFTWSCIEHALMLQPRISLQFFFYQREMSICVYPNTCMWMLLAVLFLVTQNRSQSKCLSPYEEVIYGISQNGMLINNQREQTPSVHTLMDQSPVCLLSKRSWAERLITRIQFTRGTGRGRPVGTEHKGMGLTVKGVLFRLVELSPAWFEGMNGDCYMTRHFLDLKGVKLSCMQIYPQ